MKSIQDYLYDFNFTSLLVILTLSYLSHYILQMNIFKTVSFISHLPLFIVAISLVIHTISLFNYLYFARKRSCSSLYHYFLVFFLMLF